MTRFDEWERLDADHPDAKMLTFEEVHRRYWMYFDRNVALARVVAIACIKFGRANVYFTGWIPWGNR